jgi:hypothetical protein
MTNINYLIIFLVYFFLISLTGKRYIQLLPTIKLFYPNSNVEVKEVENRVKNRTQEDIDFFKKTDDSVIYAFQNILPDISKTELKKVAYKNNNKIISLKNIINRPRPKQMSNNLDVLKSNTAHTPAFPAGHAAQAYILASHFGKIYPNKKKLLEKTADRCNDCRIKAGLHYPSDGEYSKLLFYKS